MDNNIARDNTKSVDENLVGNQHRIDINHNNKIDSEDLYILRSKKRSKKIKEGFSNWRHDLSEVISTIEKEENDKKNDKKIIKNKIKINPTLGEAVEELGGTLLEMVEIEDFEEVFDELSESDIFFLTDDLIEGVVEEVFIESIQEGYNIFEIENTLLESLEVSSALLNEAKVTYGHDTDVKSDRLEKVKSAVKKVGKGILRGAGYVAGAAVRGAKAVGREMGAGYERGRYGSRGSSGSDSSSQTSTQSDSNSDSTDSGSSKPGLLSRIGSALKRGLKKVVAKGARAVSRGARNVARRMEDKGKKAESSPSSSSKVTRGKGSTSTTQPTPSSSKKSPDPWGEPTTPSKAASKPQEKTTTVPAKPLSKKERKRLYQDTLASASGITDEQRRSAQAKRRKDLENVDEAYDLLEKAESEQQQKLFGLALSVKRGDTPRSEASTEVLKIVDTMSEKKIRDFANTSHDGLPKKVQTKEEAIREALLDRMFEKIEEQQIDEFSLPGTGTVLAPKTDPKTGTTRMNTQQKFLGMNVPGTQNFKSLVPSKLDTAKYNANPNRPTTINRQDNFIATSTPNRPKPAAKPQGSPSDRAVQGLRGAASSGQMGGTLQTISNRRSAIDATLQKNSYQPEGEIVDEAKKKSLNLIDLDANAMKPKKPGVEAEIEVKKGDKTVRSLNPQQFNVDKKKDDEKYDFNQFRSSKVFKKTLGGNKKVRNLHRGGESLGLTARGGMDNNKEVAKHVRDSGFSKKHGVNFKGISFTGDVPGKNTDDKKMKVIKNIIKTKKPKSIKFSDDHAKNLDAPERFNREEGKDKTKNRGSSVPKIKTYLTRDDGRPVRYGSGGGGVRDSGNVNPPSSNRENQRRRKKARKGMGESYDDSGFRQHSASITSSSNSGNTPSKTTSLMSRMRELGVMSPPKKKKKKKRSD